MIEQQSKGRCGGRYINGRGRGQNRKWYAEEWAEDVTAGREWNSEQRMEQQAENVTTSREWNSLQRQEQQAEDEQ